MFIFTSLLFLSGYVLQQQTVRSLQAAIRPPPPPPSPTLLQSPSSLKKAKAFGSPDRSQGHVTNQQHLQEEPSPDWTTLAYVQLLKSHDDVCNALMLFAELVEQDSPAQRLILYPRVWDDESNRVTELDSSIHRSARLLQIAAQRYNVLIFPIDPLVNNSHGKKFGARRIWISCTKKVDAAELAYPTTGLLSLTRFRRLLFLNGSGLLLQSSVMDRLLSTPTTLPISYFPDRSHSLSGSALIGMIIQPSMQSFHNTINVSNNTQPSQETAALKISGIHSGYGMNPYLLSRTADLSLQDKGFNVTTYNNQVAYVQLVDRNIPGPQYDIPRNIFLQSRPAELEARKIWEELYEMYRIRRMNICGVDLEPMPKTK